MNKRPIKCPNCDTEFSGEIKLKSRRGRAAAVAETEAVMKKAQKPAPVDDQDDDAVEEDSDEISLDEVEDMENAGADDDEADIELDEKDLEDLEEIEDLEDDDSGDDDLEVEIDEKD